MIKDEEVVKSVEQYYRDIWQNGSRYIEDKVHYMHFSQSFMREFVEYLDWRLVSIFGNFSDEFAREFKDKLWWDRMFEGQKLSHKIYKEIMGSENVHFFYV